jgi:hypothetical protein
VITGTLAGVDAQGNVLLENDDAPRAATSESAGAESAGAPDGERPRAIAFEQIRSGQLVVDWQQMGFSPRQRAGRRSAAQGRK